MSTSRYQIQSEVRRVLARHWIDLDRLHVGVYRDALRISGELHYSHQGAWDASTSLLEVLQSELRRIRDIRFIQFDLNNWARDDDGRWTEISGNARPDRAKDLTDEPAEVESLTEPESGT